MKKEDLMIGDWVNIQTEKDDEPMYSQVEQLWECEIDANFQTDYKNVHPIPLTSEILEKNGFKKVEKDLFYLGQSSIGINTWLGIDNNVIYVDALYHNREIAFYKCEYVHELQHALKLCGIEKIIIL